MLRRPGPGRAMVEGLQAAQSGAHPIRTFYPYCPGWALLYLESCGS